MISLTSSLPHSLTRLTRPHSLTGQFRQPRGQATLEYGILIGIVTVALLGMQVYAKRGLQAGVKLAADQMVTYIEDQDGDGVFESSFHDPVRAQLDGALFEAGERTSSVVTLIGKIKARESVQQTQVERTINLTGQPGGSKTTTIVTDRTTGTGEVPNQAAGTAFHSQVVSDELKSVP